MWMKSARAIIGKNPSLPNPKPEDLQDSPLHNGLTHPHPHPHIGAGILAGPFPLAT